MGLKNGWLKEKSTGDMVFWAGGVEVMSAKNSSGSAAISFLGGTPATQVAAITDSTDTSATDQKAAPNALIDAMQAFSLVAT